MLAARPDCITKANTRPYCHSPASGYHQLQPLTAQADPPGHGQGERQVLPHLPQGVRQCARPQHAPPHPRQQPQVRGLQQSLQPALVTARTHEVSHRRETLRLCSLWEEVRGQIQPESPHADAQQ